MEEVRSGGKEELREELEGVEGGEAQVRGYCMGEEQNNSNKVAFSQSVSPQQQKQSSDTLPAEPKVLDLSLGSTGPNNSTSATIPHMPMKETRRSDKQSHVRKRNK